MEQIRIPQTNVNDTHVDIVSIHVESGRYVTKGTDLFDIETTKALFTIDSPCDGYIYHRLDKNKQYRVGELSCLVSAQELSTDAIISELTEKEQKDSIFTGPTRLISKRALALLNEHQIAPDAIPGSGSISFVSVLEYLQTAKRANPNDYSPISIDELTDVTHIVAGDPNLAMIGGSFASYCDLIYLSSSDIYPLSLAQEKDLLSIGFKIRVPPKNPLNAIINYTLLSPLKSTLYKSLKERLSSCASQLNCLNLISEHSSVADTAIIEDNVLIAPFSYVGPFATIHEGSVLLPGSSVAHHSSVGRLCSLSDGSTIGGNVRIGDGCLIGLNSSINRRVNVPDSYVLPSGMSLHNDPE